jgi:molecular chaperone HscB
MLKVIDSAVPVACWSCSVAHNTSTLFCPHCSKIQPPAAGDYFSVFSLEPRLNIDTAVLEHEFHRLSRKLHPDRYARATDSEREFALADTALLNDAYRTLKDPLRRTEYLLKLMGAEVGDYTAAEGKPAKDANRAPIDLLEEVFELNMQLEEMRGARKAGEDNTDLERDLTLAKTKFERLVEAVDAELREQWSNWEAGDATARKIAQKHMVALLDRRRYLSNLVREVSETLGA